MTQPISRYPVPAIDGLPDDLRRRILEVQEKSGFVPNVFLAFAHRPDEFRAFFAYHDALMLRPPSGLNGLSKGEKEMIVVATSGANGCLYCLVAHGAALREALADPVWADRITLDWRRAGLDANRAEAGEARVHCFLSALFLVARRDRLERRRRQASRAASEFARHGEDVVRRGARRRCFGDDSRCGQESDRRCWAFARRERSSVSRRIR